MSDGGYNMIVEADDNRDDTMAADIARTLAETYPGHQWHVRIGGGMLIIKHMKLSQKMGIARRYSRLSDAGVRKREVIMAAGEFLERSGLTRGRVIEGEVVKTVDGALEKHLLPASVRVMR